MHLESDNARLLSISYFGLFVLEEVDIGVILQRCGRRMELSASSLNGLQVCVLLLFLLTSVELFFVPVNSF